MKELLTLGKDELEIAYLAIAEFALYLLIATAVVITAVYFIVKRKKPDAIETFRLGARFCYYFYCDNILYADSKTSY